ncbi:MAG: HlyD family efflux transporter periplasmic adaptor subunit, partial [Hylemonella sp.]
MIGRVFVVALMSSHILSWTSVQAADSPTPAADPESLPVQLIPEQEAVMSSLMTAKIIAIPFKLGDSFPSGAVLAEFDCQELAAKRDSSLAELKAAEETHISKLRLQALGAAGALEVTLAASTVERMQANLRLNLAQMLNCQLISPFPGKVTRIRLREQEIVAANQPVLDIVDNRSLKIQLYVPPKLARSVSIGSPMV